MYVNETGGVLTVHVNVNHPNLKTKDLSRRRHERHVGKASRHMGCGSSGFNPVIVTNGRFD